MLQSGEGWGELSGVGVMEGVGRDDDSWFRRRRGPSAVDDEAGEGGTPE